MIKLTKNSIVYVFAPANFETGGVECLYSLSASYKQLGIKTKMVLIHTSIHPQYAPNWMNIIKSKEHIDNVFIPKAYSKYIVEEDMAFEIEDNKDNLIVIPECWPDILQAYSKIQKAIWWLSVDNGITADQKGFHTRLTHPDNVNIHHFYQSQYAGWFLTNNGAQYIYPLFDYINREYIIEGLTHKDREDVILYNPKKGIDKTKKLMEMLPNYKFIPLIDMNRQQLKELMLKSKLYIDFGYHPGKDKFPREAASCGCVLITSFEGSAQFFNDIPIDYTYKFDTITDDIKELIKDVFENFETHFNNFGVYRKTIQSEVELFNLQLRNTYYEV
jgi:hypothetical protein